MTKIKFEISQPSEKFSNHLNVPNNDRIIFSAPFGSGKTYFLNEYFKQTDQFEVIHLYPVNYSVSSNQDIFELIKYDVLFELLGREIKYNELNIPHIETILAFTQNNLHNLLAPFMNMIPVIGKSAFTVYEKLEKLSKEYLETHIKAQINDKESIIKYLTEFANKKGSIYEEDFYTKLIIQLVSQLNIEFIDNHNESIKKQSVLILDDLDRIDPEHIFRILNVLSAHLDNSDNGNKFGFDKIILVFDQFNVHRIFRNKYGSDVDYNGYIDKFYSHRVFEFKNSMGLEEKVFELISLVSLSRRQGEVKLSNTANFLIQNIAYVIVALIRSEVLTVRRLTKVVERSFGKENYKPNLGINHNYFSQGIEIIYLFEFLFLLFGSWSEIITALEKCVDFKPGFALEIDRHIFIGIALVVLDVERHKFKITGRDVKNFEFKHNASEQVIIYSTFRSGIDFKGFLCDPIKILNFQSRIVEDDEVIYFPILLETALRLRDLDSIRYE